ncbi:hypothetical protein [Bdellovibrio sp. HCB2-146]|uniref:hypothetical protein n=1 Tax=Bdellovibrio sp. HCB2-146 TaxID=3394362 RepID=UPI0039BCAF16
MVSLWVTIGLIISAVCVSILGALFSIDGLAALFSGATLAVAVMAGSLEFSKFVLAAYLHQRWTKLNLLLRTYLVASVVALSAITSMGIFGFLSNAYQSATSALAAEEIKMQSLHVEKERNNLEIQRLNRSIDEIPANRITARLKLRSDLEPAVAEINKKNAEVDKKIADSKLSILAVQQKVGPLIYISKVFKVEIDAVVKYLIMLFVCIFDPLAICLVIASSESLESRRKKENTPETFETPAAGGSTPPNGNDELIQMRFTDEDSAGNKATG